MLETIRERRIWDVGSLGPKLRVMAQGFNIRTLKMTAAKVTTAACLCVTCAVSLNPSECNAPSDGDTEPRSGVN